MDKDASAKLCHSKRHGKETAAAIGSKAKKGNNATKQKEQQWLTALARHGAFLAAEFNEHDNQNIRDMMYSGSLAEYVATAAFGYDMVTRMSALSKDSKVLAAFSRVTYWMRA